MARQLPVKNTSAYSTPEVGAIVRWTLKHHGGTARTGLQYMEVAKTKGTSSHNWRLRTCGPGGLLRLPAPGTPFPVKVPIGRFGDFVEPRDHRELLVVCGSIIMSYAEDLKLSREERARSIYYDDTQAIKRANAALTYFREHQEEIDGLVCAAVVKHSTTEQKLAERKASAASWLTKRQRLEERRDRWESKLRRAETAIKKLDRQIRALERYHGKKAK